MAQKAFKITADYDAEINKWFAIKLRVKININ